MRLAVAGALWATDHGGAALHLAHATRRVAQRRPVCPDRYRR
jgi:hypothetical protein